MCRVRGGLVFSTTQTLQAGNQTFTWNGTDSAGNTWPAGTYNGSITATDVTGNSSSTSPQVQGVVTGVDISQSPPTLTVNGAPYAPSQIVQAVRTGSRTAPLSAAERRGAEDSFIPFLDLRLSQILSCAT